MIGLYHILLHYTFGNQPFPLAYERLSQTHCDFAPLFKKVDLEKV